MNPQSFGKYQLLKKLATGGMAEVWLARQAGIEGFHKNVVVKRILPHLAEDREFVEMFRNEALIAARFNHPNIAQIYEFGEANGSYYIAMEFIHGEDLGRVMRKAWGAQQWIARPLALRIVAAACEGLHYAHTRTDDQGRPLRVVHRDISPQNILISFDGSVKLVDFGIAKAADQATLTKSGAIKGKFAYMAPEQAAGKPLDARADIFAIGLVLYELLTGVRPLKRESELGTLQAALECKIEPPSMVADVPPELDPVVMQALTKAADDRYRDARQFQVALEDVLVNQRWVASSVQISELMETLFADRLQEESKLGHPAPSTEESSAQAAPLPPSPPPARSPSLADAPPARSRSSASVRASPAGRQPPQQLPGQRTMSIAEQLEAWGEASGVDVGLRRNAGEEPAPPPRRNTVSPPRTGSRTEMEAPPQTTMGRRTGSSTELEPAPGPRRTASRQSVPESEAPAPRSSTRGALAVNARSRPAEEPQYDEDDDDRTRLPEELMPPAAPAPRRRTGQVAQSQPEAPRKRTVSRVAVPAKPAPRRVEEDEDDDEASVSESVRKAPREPGALARHLKPLILVAVALAMAGGLFLYREPLIRALTRSAADQNSVFVSVSTTPRVQVSVRHTARCGMPGQVSLMGETPLARSPGAHVEDTLILENKQQGIFDEIPLPPSPPGAVHQFEREYKLGYVKLRVTPRNVPNVEIIRDGQVLGIYQENLKLELVEGKHQLELNSPQLSEPVKVDIEVRGGAVREYSARLPVAQ
jgi:serine/threonine protein kinase